MNKTATIIGIVLGLVIIIGGWWLFSQTPATTNAPSTQTEELNNQQQTTPVVEVETPPTPKTYEIVYTTSGYSPSALSIKVGDTVTFKNQSTSTMWPASAMHPTHMLYGGTSLQQHCPDAENDDFDACKNIQPGESWSFTFKKAGEWGFHDHITTGKFGKITVQ